MSPACVAGVMAGTALFERIDARRFHRIVFAALLVAGIALVC